MLRVSLCTIVTEPRESVTPPSFTMRSRTFKVDRPLGTVALKATGILSWTATDASYSFRVEERVLRLWFPVSCMCSMRVVAFGPKGTRGPKQMRWNGNILHGDDLTGSSTVVCHLMCLKSVGWKTRKSHVGRRLTQIMETPGVVMSVKWRTGCAPINTREPVSRPGRLLPLAGYSDSQIGRSDYEISYMPVSIHIGAVGTPRG